MNRSILIIGLAAMLLFASTCTEEEVLNEDLVGVWYRYALVEDGVSYGLPAFLRLEDTGSGTIEGKDGSEEDSYTDTFKWITDAGTITISDENDSTIWSGSFTLSSNNSVVQFSYNSDGHSYQEIYVKYSGERNAELVGAWIMVATQVGAEEPLLLEKVVFNQGGSGTDYLIDDLEELEGDIDAEDIKIIPITWTTTENYLIVFDFEETLPMVIQFSIANFQFTGQMYNDEGVSEEFTLVKDVGEIDANGVGEWTMSSMKINGMTNPIPGIQITLNLANDETGVWTISYLGGGSESFTFNWKTNSGYVFIYRTEMPLIAWVQEYQILGNTMTLNTRTEYFEGYDWVTVEYTFMRSS